MSKKLGRSGEGVSEKGEGWEKEGHHIVCIRSQFRSLRVLFLETLATLANYNLTEKIYPV